MRQGNLSLFYKLHSWTGLIAANLLFIICFSGAIALFKHELQAWEKPQQRLAYINSEGKIDALVYKAISQSKPDPKQSILITLPSPDHPQLEALFIDQQSRQIQSIFVNPTSGEFVEDHGNDVAHLMKMMHTDLMLPKPWGRYLVGLLGIVMLFSIVTGVVMHRKIFHDIFKLRTLRSVRLLWSDTHKLLGVWGLFFHIMIAFTGAILGLSALIQGLTAIGAFDGNVQLARDQVLGKTPQYSDTPAKMVKLDGLILKAKIAIPDAEVKSLKLDLWRDENSQIEVSMNQTQALTSVAMVKFSGVSGEQIKKTNLLEESTPFFRAFMAITPLHYAQFGGLLVKLLYYLLGLGTAMLTISGILIWDTRRKQRQKETDGNNYMSRFTVGICAGMVVATAVVFWANKLIPLLEITHLPYFWITTIYFVSWGLCLIWACVCFNPRKTIIQLVGLAAFLTIALPVLNGWLTGDWLVYTLINHQWYVAGTDLIILLTGIILALISYQLNQSKNE